MCDRGDLDLDTLDGLASLVDKSLVRAAGEQERFSMLETIREFALEMLEGSGEAEEVRGAHAEFFRTLAEEGESHTVQGDEQIMWLRRLELEHDNIRSALEFLAGFGEPEIQLRMAGALRHFWRFHGHLSEGRSRLRAALLSETADQTLRERALAALGYFAYMQGDHADARRYLEEALLIEQQNNLRERVAGTLNDLGLIAEAEGDFAGARVLFEETISAARGLGDTSLVALGTLNLADLALIKGDFEHAALLSTETLRLSRELGDAEGVAISLANGGVAAIKRGRHRQAGEMLKEALSIAKELGSDRISAICIGDFAAIAVGSGQPHEAARLLGAAKELRERIGIATGGFEAELEQATLSSLGASLGRVTLEQAFHEGEGLSAGEAIEKALHVASAPSVGIDAETKD
ncbi:MAG: tetratricopeptide repeat protein [Actinomycetota bacterium]